MLYIYIYIYIYISVAAAGLSKRGSSFSAYIIKIVHLFIRKFCPTFLFKKMLCDPVVPTIGVFSSDLTSVLSMASRARLLKQPWPIVLQVQDLSRFKQEKLLSTPADVAPIVATNENSL